MFMKKFTCSNVYSRFLFSRFGGGSQKSRKFGPRENFPLYGITYDFTCIQSARAVKSAKKSGRAKTRPARPLATAMQTCMVFRM